jgi:hypothetical protein
MFAILDSVKQSFTGGLIVYAGEPKAHRDVRRLRRDGASVSSIFLSNLQIDSVKLPGQCHRLPSSRELLPVCEFTKFELAPAMNSVD